MILDSASKGNGDNSLSTFCLEYRGAILSIVHSNINGVEYLGGTIESPMLNPPFIDLNWSVCEEGLDFFIDLFKKFIDFQLTRIAIESKADS